MPIGSKFVIILAYDLAGPGVYYQDTMDPLDAPYRLIEDTFILEGYLVLLRGGSFSSRSR